MTASPVTAAETRSTAAPGNDTIFGNLGDDQIQGGTGNDRINIIGGGRDTVRCGPGTDRVLADAHDRVTPDCERISR